MSKKSYCYLFATVMLGVFLRLYRFPQTLILGTDQGGAYILADRIINQGHILLVGPLTSLLQVNLLPPAFYYIVTFVYLLFRSEISVSLAFSFAGIVSVILIYFLGKNIFNAKSGLISALTYAVSQSMVWYGRNMWEPHLVPFFVILSLLFLFKAKNQTKLIFLHLSLFFFFLSFLYVSSLLLLPVYYFCFAYFYKSVKSSVRWPYIKTVLLFLIYGGLVYLPVIIFEHTRSYPSLNYLFQVLQGKTEYVSFQSPNYLTSVTTHIFLFINSIFINVNIFQSLIIFIIFIGLVSYITVKTKNNRFNLFVLLMFFIIAFLLSGLYSQKPSDYRLASLYPVFFLLIGAVTKAGNRTILFLIIFIIIALNIKSTLDSIRNLNLQNYLHAYRVATEILIRSENQKFTIYTVKPFDFSNFHSTPYWWALEKLTGKRLITLNDRGNWINQDLDLNSSLIYLICSDTENKSSFQDKCLDYFASSYRLSDPVKYFSIDNATVYEFQGIY